MLPRTLSFRMSSVLGLALPVVAALGVLSGCANDPPDATLAVAVARSSLARDLAPAITDAERVAFAADRADFGTDLFRAVAATTSENILVSPHSASVALAMTYAGTSGTTKTEMGKALRFTLPDAALHKAFNATDLALASRQHEATDRGGAVQFSSANSLWAQSRDGWEAPYLDALAVNYGTGINLLDFRAAAEPARVTINAWVSERTKDKIPELLKRGMTNGVSWVLVNALYLKANWQQKFAKEATRDAAFTTATGASVTVPTMHQGASLRAVHTDDYDAVELPYDGGQLAMVAVVPKAGALGTFKSTLTGRALLELPLESQLVDLSMPKFKVRTNGELTGALASLGMPTSGAFPNGVGEISVIQETYLVADEDGTEAAAATAVIGRNSSASVGPPPKTLRIAIDRPFLYAIVDKPTGAVLFLGQTTDPTK
jgi:serpin B